MSTNSKARIFNYNFKDSIDSIVSILDLFRQSVIVLLALEDNHLRLVDIVGIDSILIDKGNKVLKLAKRPSLPLFLNIF